MTSYSGVIYLFVFLPVIAVTYQICDKKLRPYLMLLAGFLFSILISGKLLIFQIVTILIMYGCGIWLDEQKKNMKKEIAALSKEEAKQKKKEIKTKYKIYGRRVLALYSVLTLGILVILKYTDFFLFNANAVMRALGINRVFDIPKWALPIGISFYTLMGISYITDVHKDVIKADRNIIRVALYMCFFPDLMEGPFTRYDETANAIYEVNDITYENLTFGCQRILYGVFKKIVVADRLNPLIVFSFDVNPENNGAMSIVGMLAYTIQLYCEFSGTMDIVIGSAEIFGVRLPENFKRPFFSKNISEFWSRWHITLGTWFRDYIYYPVSMSEPMKKLTKNARKKIGNHYGPLVAGTIALFLVWLANGFWHGSGWQYIAFGMYHFVLIFLGNVIEPPVRIISEKMKLDRNNKFFIAFQILRTFVLVNFGELIFRSPGLKRAIVMIKSMFTNINLDVFKSGDIFMHGMDRGDFFVVFISLIVILITSIISEKGFDIRKEIAKKNVVFRWAIYLLLIMVIVIFGAYGRGYMPVDPIYAGF